MDVVNDAQWTWASIWFSVALSIKMNILLFLPAFGIMMLRNTGIARTALNMVMLILVQVAIGAEFLLAFPREYLSRAFEFSRVFFYKWTVNFRFLPEEVRVCVRACVDVRVCVHVSWRALSPPAARLCAVLTTRRVDTVVECHVSPCHDTRCSSASPWRTSCSH